MNIHTSYSSAGAQGPSALGAVGGPSSSSASQSTEDGATSTSISAGGQLFSELQQLSQQSPAEFKTVAAQLAKTFQSAASQTSGAQAELLTGLANQLGQASQTGTLSPPEGASNASGASSAASSTTAVSGTAQAASTSAQSAAAQGVTASGHSHGALHHAHRRHHHGGAAQSPQVQQAFQDALSVVGQALGSSSTSSTTTTSS